ncbi:SDR family oxidoreductase [bacterium]|nr:SDR family oxidoreductase [bacterium]
MDNNKLFDVSGKVAVITGGGGILCGEMARALSKCGVKVAILDLREDVAVELADDITKRGGKAVGLACDVLDKKSIEKASVRILELFGKVDILINGAGGNSPKATTAKETLEPEDLNKIDVPGSKSFFDMDQKSVQFVFNLNFLGTLLPTQVFAKIMAEQGDGGNVVNISSMSAFRPLTKIPAYSAAKAAVSNFTQWLATHLSPVNIRVNAVAPGFFLTNQNRFLLTDEKTGKLTPRGETIIGHTPMRRFGDPADLTGSLIWLLSPASEFVTGVVVPIDGGFSAFSGV